jgi:tetratricopeptide (TPR) repeat protein
MVGALRSRDLFGAAVVDMIGASEAVAGFLASSEETDPGDAGGGRLAAGIIGRARTVFGSDAQSADALDRARHVGSTAAMAELASALAWYACRDQAFAGELLGWADQVRGGVSQEVHAGRDAYVAGGHQVVVNADKVVADGGLIDNRRIEVMPGGIPHPAEVDLPGALVSLPRPAARVFEGREAEHSALERALEVHGETLVIQVVFGLGGVGKSELALQYARAHRSDYRLVWWVTAADPAQVEAGLAGLAGRLSPPVAVAGTTTDAAGWAVGWLQAHDRWLLVLDNFEDPADVEPLLGQLSSGHVIMTSRRDADWGRLGGPLQLDVLDPAAATWVLVLRTGQSGDSDRKAAAGIAAELGYLPLALDQAAAYIHQQRITPGAYLQSLRRQPARMYAAPGARDVQRTIARLWDLHISAIRSQAPPAAWLLAVLAQYAPDAIPRSMLGGTTPLEETDEALGLLASYSIITLTADSVGIHRLLQSVILSQSDRSAGKVPTARETALTWLNAAFPDDPEPTLAAWPLYRTLVPHVEAIAPRFPPSENPQMLGSVLGQVAGFLDSQGQYARALPLQRRALEIAEASLGPDHPETAIRLDNLAYIYTELGRYDEALPLRQRALDITEATLGSDDPDMAIVLSNMAYMHTRLGQYDEAVLLEKRALDITKAALGPDHPLMATMLGNLGGTYLHLEKYAKALRLQKQALEITKAVLGPDHPETAIRLDNLAFTHVEQGRYDKALPLRQRALHIAEAALEPGHPTIATMLGNLAYTYSHLERHDEALPLEKRALEISEAALGPNHPDTATKLANLAVTYTNLGRLTEALPLQQRAAAITKAVLGPNHPSTVVQSDNLAAIYRALGQEAPDSSQVNSTHAEPD